MTSGNSRANSLLLKSAALGSRAWLEAASSMHDGWGGHAGTRTHRRGPSLQDTPEADNEADNEASARRVCQTTLLRGAVEGRK